MKRRAQKLQVVVIHGGNSLLSHRKVLSHLRKWRLDFARYKKPRSSWHGTIGAALGKRYEVIRPDMPNKHNARYAEWKIWFEKFVPYLEREVVLVGHSLGGVFLVKYLSENRFPKKVRATLLVAPPFGEGDFRVPKSFAKLVRQGGKILIYQSKDDPIVPFTRVSKYRKRLPSAMVRLFRNRGHFIAPRFPEPVRDIRGLH